MVRKKRLHSDRDFDGLPSSHMFSFSQTVNKILLFVSPQYSGADPQNTHKAIYYEGKSFGVISSSFYVPHERLSFFPVAPFVLDF